MSSCTTEDASTPAAFWESRYGSAETIWSGRVNQTTADVVSGLQPGRALDLGCGEGGDAIWLAQHGWNAVGVDIAPTAIARASAAADGPGPASGTARFEAVDLEHWSTDDEYDLVTASFFHSPVALTRASILRAAASRVAPGGHLLIVTHAAVPPWAPPEVHADHDLLSPDEEIAQLDLDLDLWDVRIKELRPRETVDPEGRAATIEDGVVLLQRRSPLLPRRRLQERGFAGPAVGVRRAVL